MDHELTLLAAQKAVVKIITYKSCGDLSRLVTIHKLCRLRIEDF